MNRKHTEQRGEAAPANREKLLASPWQRCGRRFSGRRKWLPDTEDLRWRWTRGRGRLGKMDDQTSLDRLQAHCKWEVLILWQE